VLLTDLWVFGIFRRVGQGDEDDPPFEGPKGGSVDTTEDSKEVPSAYSGESPYLPPYTSSLTGTDSTPGFRTFEGDLR